MDGVFYLVLIIAHVSILYCPKCRQASLHTVELLTVIPVYGEFAVAIVATAYNLWSIM